MQNRPTLSFSLVWETDMNEIIMHRVNYDKYGKGVGMGAGVTHSGGSAKVSEEVASNRDQSQT